MHGALESIGQPLLSKGICDACGSLQGGQGTRMAPLTIEVDTTRAPNGHICRGDSAIHLNSSRPAARQGHPWCN